MTHPSKDITGTSGTQLLGKKIALLVSSSVASFKVPEIARELMRHGADVYAVISPIIIFGIAASASFPLVVMNDLLVVLFSNKMWKKWKAWTFSQHYSLMQGLPKFGSDGSSMP